MTRARMARSAPVGEDDEPGGVGRYLEDPGETKPGGLHLDLGDLDLVEVGSIRLGSSGVGSSGVGSIRVCEQAANLVVANLAEVVVPLPDAEEPLRDLDADDVVGFSRERPH